jgi:DNA-binding MarR family transcriptional regulator
MVGTPSREAPYDIWAIELSLAPQQEAPTPVSDDLEEDILVALRRITRAIDLHSRYLANTFGLTGPQLVCLRILGRHTQLTPTELAKYVSLSQATVTGIVDRLATRQLLTRARSTTDRRHVQVTITDAGRALLIDAPSALQEKFAERLANLPGEEREIIRLTLNKIVRMMDGEDIDAAPVLSTDANAPVDIAQPVESELSGADHAAQSETKAAAQND